MMLKKMKVIMVISSFIIMLFSMLMVACIMVVVMRGLNMAFLVMVVRHHTVRKHDSICCHQPEQYEDPLYQTGAKV